MKLTIKQLKQIIKEQVEEVKKKAPKDLEPRGPGHRSKAINQGYDNLSAAVNNLLDILQDAGWSLDDAKKQATTTFKECLAGEFVSQTKKPVAKKGDWSNYSEPGRGRDKELYGPYGT